ncbi:MAG: substrate-binding domain-containing protein [Firmicutes bacterium]|nr:substrate-binding domain-containing protein [Bacillota bacterium]
MVLLLLVLAAVPADAASRDVILATTTSTQDSGLLDYLIPLFEEKTGFRVKAIAVGTGQALALGERGEADVLLTHAPAAEEQMAAAGHVVNRRRVMYNDFVVAGPAGDPAGVRGLPVVDSFRRIAEAGAVFVSRGDNSGTHMKELSLWTDAGVNPQGQPWYVETGQGMGRTLSVASERLGYTLTDRGTYLALRHLLGDMEILVEGDSILFNVYHVMQVNPEKSPMINSAGAEAFVAFMVSDEVQAIIADFGVDKYGQPLFVPYAE